MTAVVAAAWATIAGWMRIVGQVTPVPMRSCGAVAAMPPSTDQTNGLLPWTSSHGWKWSEAHTLLMPSSWAAAAKRTISVGPWSSLERV